jgi:hypothetical protein
MRENLYLVIKSLGRRTYMFTPNYEKPGIYRPNTDLLAIFSNFSNKKDFEKEQTYIKKILKTETDDKVILFLLPSFFRNQENPVFKDSGDIITDLYFSIKITFSGGAVRTLNKTTENIVLAHLAPNCNYSYVTAKCGRYVIRSGYPLLFNDVKELNSIKEIHITWEYCDSVFSDHVLYPEFRGNGKHYLIFDDSFFTIYSIRQKRSVFLHSIDPEDQELVFQHSSGLDNILTDLYPYYIKCHVGDNRYEEINRMDDFEYSFPKDRSKKSEEILIKKIVKYPACYLNEPCGKYVDDAQKLEECKYVIQSNIFDLHIDQGEYLEMLDDDYEESGNTSIYKSPKARMLKEIRITFYKENADTVNFWGAAASFTLDDKKYDVQSSGKNEQEAFQQLITSAEEVITKTYEYLFGVGKEYK